MNHNGERIREARQALGLSQVALARKVGCVKLSIINWEKGGTPLEVYRARLEKVLDISLTKEEDDVARDRRGAPRGGMQGAS
jgi:ribosome-binding protein aMBF1 (putative translation factor)